MKLSGCEKNWGELAGRIPLMALQYMYSMCGVCIVQ